MEAEMAERSLIEGNARPGAKEQAALQALFGATTFRATGTAEPTPDRSGGPLRAVPAARWLARELGIELAEVPGSGPNGRIRVEDVEAYAAEGGEVEAQPVAATPTPGPASTSLSIPPVQYRTPKGYEARESRVPLRGLRRAISSQMQASHLYTVRTLTVDEANLTQLVAFRSRLKDQLASEGVKLTYLPFIFKAIVSGLKKYPSLNTSYDEASGEIVQKHYFNLGMAVATEAGLVVPVIKDADHKSLVELAQAVTDLAERATAGKLKPEEMTGSSFSVTNIGSIGALFSFPIINVPDAAILGVHSIVKRPVYQGDELVPAQMMYLSLSFDHRLVDGAEAARFCRHIIQLLENPSQLLTL